MGKTGSVEWYQIKGRRGQVRLVRRQDANVKRPGPLHRYDETGRKCRHVRRCRKNVVGPKGKTQTR